MVAWVAWVLMDEREQKVGSRGCEGFRPIVGHREGKSQKCVFRLFPSRAHGGSLCAPLTSLAARKKSRFAEKKSASPKKNCACRIPGGGSHHVHNSVHYIQPCPTLKPAIGDSRFLQSYPFLNERAVHRSNLTRFKNGM